MSFAWLLLAIVLPAHADLYRWVDPATGSVKFSSLPPADGREAEVLRYNAPPPKPAPAAAGKSAAPSTAELEGRYRALLAQLAAQDLKSDAPAVRQRLAAYEAVRAELDRLDPAGASRRAAEAATMISRLKQNMGAQ